MARHSGKNQHCVIGPYTFRTATWTAEKLNPRVDITSGEDSGHGTYLQSIIDYEFNFDGFWNDEAPFAASSFGEGATLNVTLTADTGSTLTGIVFIERITITPEVRGPVRIRMSGVFTNYPGGIGTNL